MPQVCQSSGCVLLTLSPGISMCLPVWRQRSLLAIGQHFQVGMCRCIGYMLQLLVQSLMVFL